MSTILLEPYIDRQGEECPIMESSYEDEVLEDKYFFLILGSMNESDGYEPSSSSFVD